MLLLRLVFLPSAALASNWFSSEPDYAKWTHEQLRTWLEHHHIQVPSSFDKPHLYDLVDANWRSLPTYIVAHTEPGRQWSLDQYSRAQRAFQQIKEDTFDQWDESRLRGFLLEHGVVAPSGPREQLVLLARNKYRAFIDAAAHYSSVASESISPTYTGPTDASSSVSQYASYSAAQAINEVSRAFDDTKDYVYSTWDDNHLRQWLKDRGIVGAKSAVTKDELERLANYYYRDAASAVWESWSDSYIREWLISHNLLKPSESLSRPSLLAKMRMYYYKCTDNVWNTWSDPELKSWLVDHGFVKNNAQRTRGELIKIVAEHYTSTLDSVWKAWTDSHIGQWLSENGYLEGRDVHSRKDLVDLMNIKYPIAEVKAAPYPTWPDARLRVYLRERGISEDALPSSRPGLLQETRIRWVQTSTSAESVFVRLKEITNSFMEAAEERVIRALKVLSWHVQEGAGYTSEESDARGGC